MLNRLVPPPFKLIEQIPVQQVSSQKLSNGIDVFSLSAGSQEITRIELVFRAGMFHQPAALVASCTNSLLESGTKLYTADQISEGIDFFGSFLELQVEQDYATVTLYALNKHLESCLVYLAEVVKSPVFPENEFEIHLANKRQKFAINSEKVNVLAKRKFVELLFGEKHPYGLNVSDDDFNRIDTGQLRDFYSKRYTHRNCTIMTAGRLPEGLTDMLEKHFGSSPWGGEVQDTQVNVQTMTHPQQLHFVERDDAIQSAIRIGRRLFNKTHPDYFEFQVLNTILGGYFGSRLMTNIREDKGYTYGIGSGLTSLVNDGYFYISTEVGATVTEPALQEIYNEIAKLRDVEVDADELETVRNYMLGNFLRTIDGPFELAEKFRNIWEFGLDYSYYDNFFRAVKEVTPSRIRELANKYLTLESLLECVVGRKGA